MTRVDHTKLMLWAVLAAPAVLVLVRNFNGSHDIEGILGATGEWSARLIIVALMLTPLQRLLPERAAVRWLVQHRRAFGVAAFGYALLHLTFYVVDIASIRDMLAELSAPAIWTAWIAFLCLCPPALTSSDAAMRRLRGAWKRLQRFAYWAALFTLAHWVLIHDGRTAALLHFAPLAALQAVRLVRHFTPKNHERNFA